MNDNGESDIFTKRTPKTLDPSKPFSVAVQFSNTPDGAGLPIKLWAGFADDFALSGDTTTVAATNGFQVKQILDVAEGAVTNPYVIYCDPQLPVADVVAVASIGSGLKVRTPELPYFIVHFDGASTLTASISYYIWIIQKKR